MDEMLIDDSIKVNLERIWIGCCENVSCVLKWCFKKSSGPGFGHFKKMLILKKWLAKHMFFSRFGLKTCVCPTQMPNQVGF